MKAGSINVWNICPLFKGKQPLGQLSPSETVSHLFPTAKVRAREQSIAGTHLRNLVLS
jgi:hypothetical protein